MNSAQPEDDGARGARAARADGPDVQAMFDRLYAELRAVAGSVMRGEPAHRTLHPTALVHEAYLRLQGEAAPRDDDGRAFLRLAARAMRSVIVDHARARGTQKRGEGRTAEPLDHVLETYVESFPDLPALDGALGKLADEDPALVQVVELRFFAGLTNDEVASALGVSRPTVERRWRFARAWLRRHLEGDQANP